MIVYPLWIASIIGFHQWDRFQLADTPHARLILATATERTTI